MRSAGSAGSSFFPLDRELELLPGALTPGLAEQVVYLGMLLPFAQAQALVDRCYRVSISEPMVRRRTYAAGEAAIAEEAAFVAKLEETLERPTGAAPTRQQVSADGAMIRTKDQGWKEVRTLSIGTVSAGKDGPEVSAQSYYARLCESEPFIRGCRGEFFRRGTENVRDVEAVMDGAEWLMKLVDEHCPNAVRILDFTHAADAVIEAARAVFGKGTEACAAWIGPQLHELRHGDARNVLAAIMTLADSTGLTAEARQTIQGSHAYLARRVDQIQYASFAENGYCIGSGMSESANKHVVQVRLKGAGMQWMCVHVNAILALRSAERSGRWASTWRTLKPRLRRAPRHRPTPIAPPPPNPPAPAPLPPPVAKPATRPYFENGRPTSAHPFKRFPAVRAKK
jgi:hypothetical protein